MNKTINLHEYVAPMVVGGNITKEKASVIVQQMLARVEIHALEYWQKVMLNSVKTDMTFARLFGNEKESDYLMLAAELTDRIQKLMKGTT